MPHHHYPTSIKVTAVRRVLEDAASVKTVCSEMGIKPGSLYLWLRRYEVTSQSLSRDAYQQLVRENARLRVALVAVQLERDRLKRTIPARRTDRTSSRRA